jgi:predicted nucleic acid-binding protein
MGREYLIDTNVVIGYLSETIPGDGLAFLDTIINEGPIVSVITKIELLSFNGSPQELYVLEKFIGLSSVIGLEDRIVDEVIFLRKNKKVKTPDAIIASTAKILDLTLLTRNTTDFKNISNLQILNPWNMEG